VLVLQVSGPNGLYEAVRAGPGSWPPLPRAQEFSAAELLARPSLVAWVAAVPVPDGLTQQTMIGVGRAAMRTGASLMMASTSADGLRLTGLSTDVTAMLQALEQKKAGK
jgi:hypothetical protein